MKDDLAQDVTTTTTTAPTSTEKKKSNGHPPTVSSSSNVTSGSSSLGGGSFRECGKSNLSKSKPRALVTSSSTIDECVGVVNKDGL